MSTPAKLLAPIALGTLAVAGPTIGELALWPVLMDGPDWSADAALSIDGTIRLVSIAGSGVLAAAFTWAFWILDGRRLPRVRDHLRHSCLAYGLAIVILIQRLLDWPTPDGAMEITLIECFWCGPPWDLAAIAVIFANAGTLVLIHTRKAAA